MINHIQILKRSWNILWSYKALWIFGIILALTAARGGNNNLSWNSNNPGNGGRGFQFPGLDQLNRQFERMEDFLNAQINQPDVSSIVAVIIAILCVALVIGILFAIARYVSQVALIRMVDHFEDSGEKLSWKQGLRSGWSRSAWRLFLIHLVIFIPAFLLALGLIGCGAIPLLLGAAAGQDPSPVGIVAMIGVFFLAILALIILVAVLSLLTEVVNRVCVLQNLGVMASIRTGWAIVRRNLANVGLMGLILIGIRLVFGLVMIPVFLLFLVVGVVAGGGLGTGLFFITQAVAGETTGWIVALLVGFILFFLVIAVPLLFLGGLGQTYFSSTWTLTYREIVNVEPPVLDQALPDEPIPAV